MLVDKAEEVVECVLNDHVAGKYRLSVDRTYIRAFSLDGAVHALWKYKTVSEELLHCQAHAFCARLIELEQNIDEDDDDEDEDF